MCIWYVVSLHSTLVMAFSHVAHIFLEGIGWYGQLYLLVLGLLFGFLMYSVSMYRPQPVVISAVVITRNHFLHLLILCSSSSVYLEDEMIESIMLLSLFRSGVGVFIVVSIFIPNLSLNSHICLIRLCVTKQLYFL